MAIVPEHYRRLYRHHLDSGTFQTTPGDPFSAALKAAHSAGLIKSSADIEEIATRHYRKGDALPRPVPHYGAAPPAGDPDPAKPSQNTDPPPAALTAPASQAPASAPAATDPVSTASSGWTTGQKAALGVGLGTAVIGGGLALLAHRRTNKRRENQHRFGYPGHMDQRVFHESIEAVASGRLSAQEASVRLLEGTLGDLATGAVLGSGAIAGWEGAKALAGHLRQKKRQQQYGVMPLPPGGSMGRMAHGLVHPQMVVMP